MAFGESKDTIIRQRNEIQDYVDARYLSACESMWRTFAFHIHKRKQSVEKLIIHLEGEHNITTMFTEWMVLCRRLDETLTYMQIP
uniref:Uncharacterized protein n=1 Tax=Brassica oleracea TaxID=3712 RepID=A0A3P6EJR3_BRAOL|nr:unnamed protein product [Brassica oleracea]